MKEEPIIKMKNLTRIWICIIFFIVNLLIFVFIIYLDKSPKYFYIMHFIILGIILLFNIRSALNYSNDYLYKNSIFNSSIYIKNVTFRLHLFFCYAGFLYIITFAYIIYLVFCKKIDKKAIFYIIAMGIVGLFFAFKESILQFSQCLYSGFSSFHRDKMNFNNRCDNEYKEYWKCIQG